MERVPLSVYDVFARLAPGYLLLAVLDHVVARGAWFLDGDLSMAAALLWLGVAFVTGEVIAAAAELVVDRWFVDRFLLPPSVHLLRDRRSSLAGLFPRYMEPLAEPVRSAVLRAVDGAPAGEPAFLAAFAKVRARDEAAPARLGAFLTLSGFCRNTGLALLISAVLFAAAPLPPAPADGTFAFGRSLLWLCLAAGLVLLARHLKYRRLYTREVFLSAVGDS